MLDQSKIDELLEEREEVQRLEQLIWKSLPKSETELLVIAVTNVLAGLMVLKVRYPARTPRPDPPGGYIND